MIELRNVGKTFDRGQPNSYCALMDVDAFIAAGEVALFCGPSGSGKTTLLALTGCMLHPTSGRIFIDDLEVTCLTQKFASALRRRMFGFVFQEFHLVGGLSALENTMLPAYPTGASFKDLSVTAMALLERLGLGAKAHAGIETLSGGEKQRVAVARALVNAPRVVIADEPTAHLDAETATRFLDLVAELRDEGTTVLIASHDPLLIESHLPDRVFHLAEGRLVEEVSPCCCIQQ